ncbi:MAG TPA: DUF808 family protein [Sphingomicrobium sp.]|nr:DUF808 family protein [Sphingomicrobium sp.]
MPSGLIALLDDVATLTKLAAASVDDIGLAAGKAGTKAAGVIIDDTAVTPRYVIGLAPERELPIIGKIAVGSLKNKLLILLPAALLLSAFLPVMITPLLMIGGAYLAFEATEKILEKITGEDHHTEQLLEAVSNPQELEDLQVAGAIRTDFILSAEIMAIALAELESNSFGMQAAALGAVGVAITAAVYGAVGLIVKLDDIGLHLVERSNAGAQALGRGLVQGVPKLLTTLSVVGTAAMLWVGGGIFLHGLEELHLLVFIPGAIHDAAHAIAVAVGIMPGVVEWIANAVGAAIAGAVVGAPIVYAVKAIHRRRRPAAAA